MPFGARSFRPAAQMVGGVHELAVDGDGAVGVHEVANRAAGADEDADAAAQLFELRDGWRGRRRRLRGSLP